MGLYGIIGDIHGPWNDERATNLAFDVMEDLGVNHIILNGDILDFYSINAYGPKHQDIQTKLEDEINWGKDFLTQLRVRFPKEEIIYIFGNHEYRLDKFIMANCPVFWNIIKLEKMLGLKDLKIKWVPYNEKYRIGKANLFAQHSPPSYAENAANTSFKKKFDVDHIWGCTHRSDRVVKTGSSGKVYTSYINGWFGDKGIITDLQARMPENRRVFQYTKNHEQWNSSFCIVSVDKKKYHVQQVIIKDYTAVVGGNLYEG